MNSSDFETRSEIKSNLSLSSKRNFLAIGLTAVILAAIPLTSILINGSRDPRSSAKEITLTPTPTTTLTPAVKDWSLLIEEICLTNSKVDLKVSFSILANKAGFLESRELSWNQKNSTFIGPVSSYRIYSSFGQGKPYSISLNELDTTNRTDVGTQVKKSYKAVAKTCALPSPSTKPKV